MPTPVWLTDVSRVTQVLTQQSLSPEATAFLSVLCGHVTARMAREMGRDVERTERTIYLSPTGDGPLFFLRGAPIDEVSSIREDADREFGSDTEIDEDRWYARLGDAESGRLEIDGPLAGTDTIRVVYTGGLGPTLASIAADFPDLVGAATLQVVNFFQRKEQLGGGSMSGGGDVSVIYDGVKMLPEVVAACRARRLLTSHAA